MTSPALSKPLSLDEFRGLATIARARRERLITMFSGARIGYGTTAKASAAYKIGSMGRKVYSSASRLTNGTDVVKPASELQTRGLDPLVETAMSQISHSRITMERVKTGKGIVESKGIADEIKSVSVANARCQFERQARATLPF